MAAPDCDRLLSAGGAGVYPGGRTAAQRDAGQDYLYCAERIAAAGDQQPVRTALSHATAVSAGSGCGNGDRGDDFDLPAPKLDSGCSTGVWLACDGLRAQSRQLPASGL